MAPSELMPRIDALLSHVWMVRTFLKHSEEAADDQDLAEIHRDLYDYMLALGAPWKEGNQDEYLKIAKKKLGKLQRATANFLKLQPEVSTHMNFQMAARSLETVVQDIARLLGGSVTPQSDPDQE